MPTQILVSSDPWENRVAVLEGGQLAEIYFEREEKVIGSIFKGRIQNVLVSMGASFVDIGLGRNAFLYVDDINRTPLNIGNVEVTQGRSGYSITEKVSRGDDVLVQIVKEPRGLKGARVSTNISLPGRYLTLMPTGRYSGVSRKIGDAAERDRLKNIVKRIRPEGMATIVRTAAAGVSDAELIADLGVLLRMWHGILETYKVAPSPSLIHKDMNLIYKAARDFVTPEVDKILIDDPEEYQNVRDFLRLLGPQYVERVQLYDNGRPLFADYKIDEELAKLMRPRANLPSGGSIIIETTEALTVIDINSGNTGGKHLEDTIVRTNVEAAAEIARQVRLRDIGGIIVCDFIDMASEASRNKVLATLEEGLRRDRTRTTIQSFSALGLLEFTRKRVGKDLSQQLRGACPTCNGLGSVLSAETVAIEALRKVRSLGHVHENGKAHLNGAKSFEVIAAPTVGTQLDFWYEDEVEALEATMGSKIFVRVDAALHPERLKVEELDGKAATPKSVRVGDEFEVDVLNARLPNATSGVALVDGQLIEVEGAAAAAGRSIKVRVIDVDDEGNVLAESRVAMEQAPERKRRRRGGRGRAKSDLSPAEQAEELRELAEEAAKGVEARPVIGISTAAEAEQEEAAVRQPHAVGGTPAGVPGIEPADSAYGDQKRKRRRRRRGGRREDEAGAPIGNGAFIPKPPLERPQPLLEAGASDASAGNGAESSGSAAEEEVRKRRRRRRRRGRGGRLADGTENKSNTAPERGVFRAGVDGVVEDTGEIAPPEPVRAMEARPPRPIAVEPPPPSLSVSEETQVAKPAPRRRAAKKTAPPESLGAAESVAALPAPADETAKPKRRTTRTAAKAEPKATGSAADGRAKVQSEEKKPTRGRPKKAPVESSSAAVGTLSATPEPSADTAAGSGTKKKALTKSTATKSTAKKKTAAPAKRKKKSD